MSEYTLYLLKPPFTDPEFPGDGFYCYHCMLMEGLLSTYPDIRSTIDVRYVDFTRPRSGLIEQVGETNQSVPNLVLSDNAPTDLATGTNGNTTFVQGVQPILHALHVLCGIPKAHP